jgi:hypothetical protein
MSYINDVKYYNKIDQTYKSLRTEEEECESKAIGKEEISGQIKLPQKD